MSADPRHLLSREANRLLIALGFLSRLPVYGLAEHRSDDFDRCTRWFVAGGLIIGALSVLPGLLFEPAQRDIAVWLTLGTGLLLTGAFHEDGLADSADGLGGGLDREARLRIMRDSRIGTYGAVALIVALQLKANALIALGEQWLWIFIALQGVSRAVPVALMHSLPRAQTSGGKPKPDAGTALDRNDIAIALSCAAGVLLGALWLGALDVPGVAGVLLVALGVWALCRSRLRRLIGGYTGDTLGASQQLSEIGALLALVALQTHG